MKIDELTKFLNERANGMRCPICQSSDWYLKVKDGEVAETNVSSNGIEAMNKALIDCIVEFGGALPEEESTDTKPEQNERDLLSSCVILRCNHCGHLELFDRSFIEEQIHGQNR